MIVWIPLLKKLMFRRLMTSPPSEIVTRASAIWSLSVGSVPPASVNHNNSYFMLFNIKREVSLIKLRNLFSIFARSKG